jgi:hypothetical protein
VGVLALLGLTDSLLAILHSEETFERLRKAMIPRASDKLATVRIQTVLVLKRLQDNDEPTDEVTAELVRLMVSDPNKYVCHQSLSKVLLL